MTLLVFPLPGINNGLQIRLNLEQYEYYFSPFYRVSAGFQMLVYEYGSHALIEDQGFGISPGTHTFVGIDVIEVLQKIRFFLFCSQPQLYLHVKPRHRHHIRPICGSMSTTLPLGRLH